MSRRARARNPVPERQFRAEAVLRPAPDLHRLAQVFLGMALDRAAQDRTTGDGAAESASNPTLTVPAAPGAGTGGTAHPAHPGPLPEAG